MKILVCGAGRITDELLKRIGANWEITLVEKKEAKLVPFSSRFSNDDAVNLAGCVKIDGCALAPGPEVRAVVVKVKSEAASSDGGGIEKSKLSAGWMR